MLQQVAEAQIGMNCDITTAIKGFAVTCVRNSTYKRFVAAAQICRNDLSRNVSRPLKLATLLFSSFPRCQPDWCAHVMTQQYVCCPQAPASVSLPCCYQTWVLSLMWLTLLLKVRRDENWLSYIIFQFLLDLHMSGRYIFQRCRADNWERSPPTGGPWVRIPDLKSCVGWLCSFLVFAPKIFPQVPLFSSFHKNRHSSPSKSYPLVQLFLLCTKF